MDERRCDNSHFASIIALIWSLLRPFVVGFLKFMELIWPVAKWLVYLVGKVVSSSITPEAVISVGFPLVVLSCFTVPLAILIFLIKGLMFYGTMFRRFLYERRASIGRPHTAVLSEQARPVGGLRQRRQGDRQLSITTSRAGESTNASTYRGTSRDTVNGFSSAELEIEYEGDRGVKHSPDHSASPPAHEPGPSHIPRYKGHQRSLTGDKLRAKGSAAPEIVRRPLNTTSPLFANT